mgnify:CR=1 FL=1
MPPDQVAFIHEAKTDVQKKELFSKVRSGQVRVLIGSTFKMGAGTNVQDKLTSSQERAGDFEVIICEINFCLFSTVCHK